jgi:hypothetical protein
MGRHVACMGRIEIYAGFWWGNLRVKDNLKEAGIERRIILRWIIRKRDERHGLE